MIQTLTSKLDLDEVSYWLQERLSPERFKHSLGAHEKACELAEKFQLSPSEQEAAAIAALVHDAAKLMNSRDLLNYCDEHHIPIDDIDRKTPHTLHPYVGAEMVRERFDIQDPIILDAIRFHTTGRAGMSVVEKIVYIADKIETNTRNPLYSKRMTAPLDFRDIWTLDLTMVFILDSTIQFLMDKHQLIHPRTMDARNDFIERLRAADKL